MGNLEHNACRKDAVEELGVSSKVMFNLSVLCVDIVLQRQARKPPSLRPHTSANLHLVQLERLMMIGSIMIFVSDQFNDEM